MSGAKHFYYWTYGPTATSTENYWSDLRGEYDGIAAITRQLSKAEKFLIDGRLRPTKVALLYSISSDLWQPFGYVHMLERRLTYFALVHEHYLVDMLTEEDIIAGKLKNYSVLYVTDPCIHQQAIEEIKKWVRNGGYIRGTCAAGTRNQFNEQVSGLTEVFGIKPYPEVTVQKGRWHIRGALNEITYIDTITVVPFLEKHSLIKSKIIASHFPLKELGTIGVKVYFKTSTGIAHGIFSDGNPSVITNKYGRGTAEFIASCPAIAYGKEAGFVPDDLKEKWNPEIRRWVIGNIIKKAEKLVEISHPVVEAGVYDSNYGTALILANFTYEPIENLKIGIDVQKKPARVFSFEKGEIKFNSTMVNRLHRVNFSLPLGINDIVLIEYLQ